jgi:hypothetical protein
MEALRPVLEKCGQQHLLEGYEQLPAEQQAELLEQLQVGAAAAEAVAGWLVPLLRWAAAAAAASAMWATSMPCPQSLTSLPAWPA